jgi:hypothetical protein
MNDAHKFRGEVSARALQALIRAIGDKHPDPHKAVAAVLFDVPEQLVTPEQRKMAKAENYRHLYNSQPQQVQSFEPWVHVESGNPYTLVARGRHRRTLQPYVYYIDREGCGWFGEDAEFRSKFVPMDDYTKRLDLGAAEAKVAAHLGDGDATKRDAD